MKFKLLTMALVLPVLTGCNATLGGMSFTNRLAPTLACDETFVISQYGPVGISSKVDPKDHAKIAEKFCK